MSATTNGHILAMIGRAARNSWLLRRDTGRRTRAAVLGLGFIDLIDDRTYSTGYGSGIPSIVLWR